MSAQLPRSYRQVWWEDVRVGGRALVGEVTRPDRDQLIQMQGHYSRPELNDALADWQEETPIPGTLQHRLRAGEAPGSVGVNGRVVDLGELADQLREAIGEGELTSDAELWRGLTLRADELEQYQPGAELIQPGFMATSMNREWAENMAEVQAYEYGGTPEETYVMRVLAPAGTHVAPGASALAELLLRDQTRVRVISVEVPEPRPNPWTGEPGDGWGMAPGVITLELID